MKRIVYIITASVLLFATPLRVNAQKSIVYNVNAVSSKPQFPYGQDAMLDWIDKNCNYSEISSALQKPENVLVQFIVEKDGTLSDINVLKGVNPTLDAEAVRIVKTFPKLLPAKIYGELVRCRMEIEVPFFPTIELIEGVLSEIIIDEPYNGSETEDLYKEDYALIGTINESTDLDIFVPIDLDISDTDKTYTSQTESSKPNREEIYTSQLVDQKPEFPGGDKALYQWIAQHINYPSMAAEQGISGKVTIEFVITKDGSITYPKVVRGKHPDLDAEALRLVKSMPKWTPGRNHGVPVKVRYTLPVTFKLAVD